MAVADADIAGQNRLNIDQAVPEASPEKIRTRLRQSRILPIRAAALALDEYRRTTQGTRAHGLSNRPCLSTDRIDWL
jgi:hypothetical protein